MLAVTFLILGLFAVRMAAQHEQHSMGAQPQQESKSPPTMPGGMAMCQHMMAQQEVSDLIDNAVRTFETARRETDPAALKSKLAEHSALLKELQTKMAQARCPMQQGMGSGEMTCPMMGGGQKPE
jgi:hypothetical protein